MPAVVYPSGYRQHSIVYDRDRKIGRKFAFLSTVEIQWRHVEEDENFDTLKAWSKHYVCIVKAWKLGARKGICSTECSDDFLEKKQRACFGLIQSAMSSCVLFDPSIEHCSNFGVWAASLIANTFRRPCTGPSNLLSQPLHATCLRWR